ncbi:MAG: ABC transporter permease, partial [Candidatus Symbiothrix sp.]|nr:ABC transporter permease [Candidatus Symbiothrix sp.]
MKDLVLAFRTLSGKGQNNFIKILSLGIGLAVGLVLISKIYLDLSFENFYPDAERIYQIQEDVNHQDEGEDVFSSYGQVSGGVASGMKTEIPQVEAATRFTGIGDDMTFYTVEDKKAYKTDFAILGDSSLFDVLPRPVLAGNPKEVLSRPMQVMISHSIAKNRGNIQDIIGKKIYLDNFPGKELTIGGIFEDIPANSEQRYDMVISMPSISEFMWDGSMNWLGNDRYLGYVKLQPNTHPENLATAIRQMQAKYQPLDELEKLGVDLHYSLLPLTKMHSDRPEIKRMTILLSLLAFAILFTAILNYILVVISSLVNRTKGVAIRKCYGADTNNISSSMFAETGVHLLISLLIAVALIILFRDTVEDLLAVPLSALFNLRSGILLVIACVVVFFITAIVPAQIFSKIPVSLAFRNYQETRRIWKLALLFLQFTATAFLVTFLI